MYKFLQINIRKEDVQPYDLGIEITIAKFLNGQQNLDHHGPDSNIDTPSACVQALEHQLPKDGAIIATIRPDADSVTAMAILANRLAGRQINKEVIRLIDLFDRRGPRAMLPQNDKLAALTKAGKSVLWQAGFDVISHEVTLSVMRMSSMWNVSLEDKVKFVQSVLDGTYDHEKIMELVAAADKEAAEARKVSKVEIRVNTRTGGKVAVVVSTTRLATMLGYEEADIVVALNPEMKIFVDRQPTGETYKKFTVAKRNEHVPVDLQGVLNTWQQIEPGAGGRDTIIGSTQGEDSVLELEQLVQLVFSQME